MGFYDINEGGYIGDAYIRAYDTPGIKSLSNSIRRIPRQGLICHVDISNPNCYPGTGTTITDLSGTGINFTIGGTNEIFSSDYGGSIQFTNAAGYATTPAGIQSTLNFTSGDFSFSLWYRCNNLRPVSTARHYIFMKGVYNASGYSFYVNNNSRFQFETYQSGAIQTTNTINNLQPMNVDRWCNVTVTRSGTSVLIYVDGEDYTSNAGTHTNPTSTAASFYLNSSSVPGEYGRNTNIGMVLIYNRQLSASEVLDIFNATESRFPV